MKTLKYILFVLSSITVAVACNPMEDINNTLKNEYSGPKNTDLEYTLEYNDYKAISKTASLDAVTVDMHKQAKQVAIDTVLYPGMSSIYIPNIINNNNKYLGYGEGSSITVTYRTAEAIGDSYQISTEMLVVGKNKNWQTPSIINFSFGKSDYQALTNYVKANSELSKHWESNYDGREIYYGSSAKYSNFDMRYSTRAIKDDSREAIFDENLVSLYNSGLEVSDFSALNTKLAERSLEGMMLMLELKYAEGGANITSNGNTITYETRSLWFLEGYVNQYVTCKYECIKASPNAKFKLIEGPIYE